MIRRAFAFVYYGSKNVFEGPLDFTAKSTDKEDMQLMFEVMLNHVFAKMRDYNANGVDILEPMWDYKTYVCRLDYEGNTIDTYISTIPFDKQKDYVYTLTN